MPLKIDQSHQVSTQIKGDETDLNQEIAVLFEQLTQITDEMSEEDLNRFLDLFFALCILTERDIEKVSREEAMQITLRIMVKLEKLSKSFNNKGFVILQVLASTLQVAGGVVGITATFPGTPIGDKLAHALPQFFNAPGHTPESISVAMEKISKYSNALSSGGQAVSHGNEIVKNDLQQRQTIHQSVMREFEQNRSHQNENERNEKQDQDKVAQLRKDMLDKEAQLRSKLLS